MSEVQALHMFPGLEPRMSYKVVVFFHRTKLTLKKTDKISENLAQAVKNPYEAVISFPEGPLYLEINAVDRNEINEIACIAVNAIAHTQKVAHYFVIQENEWSEKRDSNHVVL